MDAHYDSQIKSLSQTNFSGPARQMGAGGLGAFAVRLGRVAMPLMKNYILPAAKQVGKHLLESAIPEIGHVLTGKKKPNRKLLQHVASQAATKTLSANMSGRVTARPSGSRGGRAVGTPARAKREGGQSTSSRKRKANSSNILPKSSAKRSRSDILSEIQFSPN